LAFSVWGFRGAFANLVSEGSHLDPTLGCGFRVLVAEDNDVNQLLVEEMLARIGFECTLASKGRLPIIALTVGVVTGDREHCLQSGLDDYSTKPIERSQFLDVIRRWLPLESRSPEATLAGS
jgi:CheY-like chemotaxis protein